MNIFRRRRPATAAVAPTLATYASPHWAQRHRIVSLAALLAFAFLYSAAFTLIGRFLMVQFMVPIVVLMGVVVWMLPENDRPPTRALEMFAFAYVAVLLCWPDYLAVSLPGLPWITLLRLTGFPMTILLLLCVSVSPTFRAQMKDRLSVLPAIWKCIAALSVLGLLSIGLSPNPASTANRYVIMLVNWVVPFFVGVYVFSLPHRIKWLSYMLWAIAMVVTLIGLQEWRHGRLPWAGHIPSFLVIEDEAVARILTGTMRAATGIYRVQSKFTTPLGLAEFLSLALPFILHIIVKTNRTGVRLAAIASLPPIVWVVLKTDARLGIVGVFMSLLFYALAWGAMRWRSDKASLFGPALTIAYPVIFVAFLISTFFVGRLRGMVWGNGPQTASTESRRQMYEMGVPMVLKNPIGHGLGEGGATLGFTNPAGTLTIDTYYLSVALELGIAGFVIYFGMFLFAMYKGAQTVWRAPEGDTLYLVPVVISLANFFISKSVLSQQENHPLVFLLLGASLALMWRAKGENAARPTVGAAAASYPGSAVPA